MNILMETYNVLALRTRATAALNPLTRTDVAITN